MSDSRRDIRSLFAGSDLRVFGSGLHLPRVLLTFTSWNKRSPVHAGLAKAAGMGYVGFAANQNHWWQTDEFPEALEIVRSRLADDTRLVAFGSSMGGAGALLAAQFIEVGTVLAVAPPIIVDAEVTPWEKRFSRVRDLTKCRFLLQGNVSPETATYVIYDPFYSDDVNHLQLLEAAGRSFARWPLPHSNHNPLLELSRAGLYRDFTTAFFIDDDPDAAWAILREAQRVRGLPQLALARRRKFGKARYVNPDYITFLTALLESHGPQAETLEERGLAYRRQGHLDEALADFKQTVQLEKRKRFARRVEQTAAEIAKRD